MTDSEKVIQAIENEDLVLAQEHLQAALKHDEADLLAALGDELLTRGFLEEAQQIFTQLVENSPETGAFYIPLAEIAIDNNQVEEAFEYLEKVTTDDEAYPQSLLVTADLYQMLGIPEVSEAKLLEVQTYLPEEPLIDFALGELYFSNDQFSEAIARYQKLVHQGVSEISGVLMDERIGTALGMAGEFEEAIPYLEAAVAVEATDDRLFQLAFTYLQLKENQKVIHYLQQLRETNPQYQSLYLFLAEALQEEELLEEAQDVIEEGLRENPFQVDLYHFASENAFRLHDVKCSEELLLQALELGEKQEETLLTLSNLYLSEERYQEVVDTINRMEESDNPYAEWNLAKAYEQLEDFDVARVHYEQAAHELEHEAEFLKDYGIFLRDEGNLTQAKALLQHYLHHEPGDLEVASILEDLEGDQDAY
ncbi:tetratricopeptide repeat protein [Enterococcus sp. HY326]|uniref:tetratricopeptide repeat protein n=1 Tax=Enterococcus sp. HY326 TaxID=2971265 RepID=UPI00223FA0D5|nr:tetratricopeptide repeat protein [Enterococcus sp. HY326]